MKPSVVLEDDEEEEEEQEQEEEDEEVVEGVCCSEEAEWTKRQTAKMKIKSLQITDNLWNKITFADCSAVFEIYYTRYM